MRSLQVFVAATVTEHLSLGQLVLVIARLGLSREHPWHHLLGFWQRLGASSTHGECERVHGHTRKRPHTKDTVASRQVALMVTNLLGRTPSRALILLDDLIIS